MKVMWFSNIPSPYRSEFLRQLAKLVELTVVFHSSKSLDRDDKWYDTKLENINCVYLDNYSKIESAKINYTIMKGSDIVINCDYSHPFGMFLILSSKVMKKKILMEIDGGVPKKRIINPIISFFMRLHDGYVSSGELADKYLNFYGVKKNIYRFHFSSLTKKEIENNQISSRNKCMNDQVNILAVGQFIHRKGFDVLIGAVNHVNKDKYNLTIIGGDRMIYESMITNENIELIGFLEKSKLHDYFSRADIFVVPSREEIWGLVVNEAISYNIPIIASENVMAALEFQRYSENITIYHNNDTAELKRKIEMLGDRPMAVNYEEINNLYNIEKMVQDHVEIFKLISKETGESDG